MKAAEITLTADRRERERTIYRGLLESARMCLGVGLFNEQLFPRDDNEPGAVAEARIEGLYRQLLTENPGKLAKALQKRLSDPRKRAEVARKAARLFPALDEVPAQASELARRLNEHGFIPLPILLTANEVAELADHLRGRTTLSSEEPLHHHKAADVAAAPHILRLATHPLLLSIARAFLGCAPTIVNLEAWWSPVTGHETGPQILHRDKDDFRACKFFMYLTDVDREDGPFIYAQRSQDPDFVSALLQASGIDAKWLPHIFSMQNGGRDFAAGNQQIFAPLLVEVLGTAGTSFMINSFGLHRGRPPSRGRRGAVAITYGMIGYPDRLDWFEEVALNNLSPDLPDAALTRHAARLLLV